MLEAITAHNHVPITLNMTLQHDETGYFPPQQLHVYSPASVGSHSGSSKMLRSQLGPYSSLEGPAFTGTLGFPLHFPMSSSKSDCQP